MVNEASTKASRSVGSSARRQPDRRRTSSCRALPGVAAALRLDLRQRTTSATARHWEGPKRRKSISRALPGYAAKDPVKTGELVESLGAYTALLKHHIHVEDHVFYPMAERTLSSAELETIAGEFDKQHAKHGHDTFERCHKMVVDMGSILTHVR